jgi:hypothetical protein
MKINVTVDLDWLEDGESVNDQIIKYIALEVIKSQDSTINRRVQETVDMLIKDKINQQLECLVIERMTKGVQKTTEWGEPKGEVIPFSALVVDRMNAYLEERVDSDGRPQNSYNSRQCPTRLEQAIASISKSCVDKAVSEMRQKIQKEFDESTKSRILNEVTQAVIKTLNGGK